MKAYKVYKTWVDLDQVQSISAEVDVHEKYMCNGYVEVYGYISVTTAFRDKPLLIQVGPTEEKKFAQHVKHLWGGMRDGTAVLEELIRIWKSYIPTTG